MEIIQDVIQWFYPVIYVFLIILAATRARLRAKLWLIAYLAGSVLMSLVWRMPQLLLKLHVIEVEAFSTFYDWFAIPLSIVNILFVCLLIPYILLAPVPKTLYAQPPVNIPK
jgi:hypothetical protein